MKNEKQSWVGFKFKALLMNNWFEMLIELVILVLGLVIVCLFPLLIFEEWPELAMLIGAVLVVGVVGLVAMIIHLIKRKRK